MIATTGGQVSGLACLMVILAFARLACADGSVAINEIMYHPAVTGSADMEWIELYNRMSIPIALDGWALADGVSFVFPTGTVIRGGEYLLVAKDPSALAAATGSTNVLGPFVGRLSNGGDTIELRTHGGWLIDRVEYGDRAPWAIAPDGGGPSLAKRDPQLGGDLPEHWAASTQVGGTPGARNFHTHDPEWIPLVTLTSPASVWVPDNDVLGQVWTQPAFDDSAWSNAVAAVGFDTQPGNLYASEVMDDAPSGYWRLDETSGDVARDSSGNGRNGAYGGGVTLGAPSAVGAGRCARFDGSSGYVQLPGTWGGAAEATVETWVRTEAPITGDFQSLIATPDGGFTHLQLHTIGNAGAYTTAGFVGLSIPEPTPTAIWRHVAMVIQSGDSRIYVDGVQFGQTVGTAFNSIMPATYTPGGSRGVRLANGHLGGRWLRGSLDEAAIYDHALTAERIHAHYLAGSLEGITSLVGTNLEAWMHGTHVSAYVRIPFTLEQAGLVEALTLRVRYDDGFVAYLNGTPVASRNAPVQPEFDSVATLDRVGVAPLLSEDIPLSAHLGLLVDGTNMLALHAMNVSATNHDFLLAPELLAHLTDASPAFVLNEISSGTDAVFRVELVNVSSEANDAAGYELTLANHDASYIIPPLSVAPGQHVAFSEADIGFRAADGDVLFLYEPGRRGVADAVEIGSLSQSRVPDGTGSWIQGTAWSFGGANGVWDPEPVVINEIMYHHQPLWETTNTPFAESDEEWVELHNWGSNAVQLTGWHLDGGIAFDFVDGTSISPGGFLVVARDPEALREAWPGIGVTGPFLNRLSDGGDELVLRDANDNVVDRVRYFDGGRWPAPADGGGSSLELRDPRADNAHGDAWGASDESGRATWRSYTYRGTAAASVGPDSQWREFVLGVLDEGTVLLDDISLIEDPDGSRVQLLANTTFSTGLASWRCQGNHGGEIVPDPDDSENAVLRLTASGPTEHFSNHIETTLTGGRSVVNGRVYEIAFRARWVSGCPRLNTRLYFNRLPRTTVVVPPRRNGTPGATNSQFVANQGPTFDDLGHYPVVPRAGETVKVSVEARDPDGISAMTLFWRADEGAWSQTSMVLTTSSGVSKTYSADLPGQPAATVSQFYVSARDGLGAVSCFPAGGPASRALFATADGQADLAGAHTLRVIMLASEASAMHANSNVMSNAKRPCTVVYDENVATYDCGVRLRGSTFSRPYDSLVSFSLYFPAEAPFRGAHTSVDIDRSGRGLVGSPGQDEILVRHLLLRAELPCEHSDLIRFIAPLPRHTSSAMLNLGNLTGTALDSVYPGGGDGMLFELDGAYYPTRTTDGDEASPKVAEAGAISYTDIRDLGDDPEAYRWHLGVRNGRARDDYSKIVAMAKAFDLTGPALDTNAAARLDVNQWMRVYAALTLCGVSDAYTMGNPHNLWLYERPSDGRMLAVPHDWDVCFNRAVTAPLLGNNGNLLKIINLPGNRHLLNHHLYDLVLNTWNAAHMGPWADRYDDLLPGQDFSSIVDYIEQRSAYVLSQMPAEVPFSVTTGVDGVMTVTGTTAQVEGEGWIDISQFRIAGREIPLSVTWTGESQWRAAIPVDPGENRLTLEVYGVRNELLIAYPLVITSLSTTPRPSESLRVTEIHYNPSDSDEYEFIELRNDGTGTLSLAGVCLADAVEFTFGEMVLPGGARIVVVENADAFSNRYQDASSPYAYAPIRIAGEWTGALSDAGETLRVVDRNGATIEHIRYAGDGSWPGRANGRGASLQRARPEIPPDRPEHWRASWRVHGSPGRGDPDPGIVINEVMSHSDTGQDWIELLNIGTKAVDISGWYLSDALQEPLKFAIPPRAPLWPGAFAVYEQNEFGVGSNAFSFSELGDEAVVVEVRDGYVSRVIAYEDFGAAARDVPFGRYVRYDGSTCFPPLSAATRGSTNAPPLVGPVVISEVMYHPLMGVPEYIELLNISTSNVALYDPVYPTNTWKLTSAVSYSFPPGTVLNPRQRVMVTQTNPAAFTSALGLPNGEVVFGPWHGSLDNEGESIRLRAPGAPEQDGTVPYVTIDRVDYRDYTPWPLSADGHGPSLERLDCLAFGNDGRNWWAKPVGGGTPGSEADIFDLRIPSVGRIGWLATTSEIYRVEYRNELLHGEWRTLVERRATVPLEETMDPDASTQESRFYRLRWIRQ